MRSAKANARRDDAAQSRDRDALGGGGGGGAVCVCHHPQPAKPCVNPAASGLRHAEGGAEEPEEEGERVLVHVVHPDQALQGGGGAMPRVVRTKWRCVRHKQARLSRAALALRMKNMSAPAPASGR